MHAASTITYGHAMPSMTRFIISATLTAVLILPAFFVFRKKDSAPVIRQKPSTVHKIYVLPSVESDPEMQKALDNIHAWIELKSPDKTNNPESNVGFKEFAQSKPSYPYDDSVSSAPFSDSKTNASPSEPAKTEPALIGEAVMDPPHPMNAIVPWKPFWSIALPESVKMELPSEVIWRNAQGKRIANAPELDMKKITELWNKNTPSRVTTLECSLVAGKMPPRVIVRDSCGNADLDRLAADALRRHLLSDNALSALTSKKFKNFTVDVIWQLQQSVN